MYFDDSIPSMFKADLHRYQLQNISAIGTLTKAQAQSFFESQGVSPEKVEWGSALLAAMGGFLVGKGGAAKANINVAKDFISKPQSIWGRSADDIASDFRTAGYEVNVRQSTRGSGQALIVEVKGHPQISQIQVHPGGGRHEGAYYKVSTTTDGTIKVVDPLTYKPTPGEKAKIISGG